MYQIGRALGVAANPDPNASLWLERQMAVKAAGGWEFRAELAAKDEIIAAKDAIIAAKDEALAARAQTIADCDRVIAAVQHLHAKSQIHNLTTIERLEAKVLALGGSL